jgi:hypothetical protein
MPDEYFIEMEMVTQSRFNPMIYSLLMAYYPEHIGEYHLQLFMLEEAMKQTPDIQAFWEHVPEEYKPDLDCLYVQLVMEQ